MSEYVSPEDQIRMGARQTMAPLTEVKEIGLEDRVKALEAQVQELADWRAGLEVYLGQHITRTDRKLKRLEALSRPGPADPLPVAERIVINNDH